MSEEAGVPWGRVDDQGNVYLRTKDGEKIIAQWLGGDPAEALSLYRRKYDGLVVEVELLEKRIATGAASPDDAMKAVAKARESIESTHAIGDIDALYMRLEALGPLIAKSREARKEQKAERIATSRAAKERIATAAERIATGNDWKSGVDKLRSMLEEWKKLPHLDKKSDDELWHRFSAARTAYTKRRRAHFAELSRKRETSAKIKEKLAVEAEALAGSTDFGPTTIKYRELMQQWKAAGPAPREDESRLWNRFRGAQDTFFGARDAFNAERDKEFEANAEVKEQILIEAEKLLPVKDVDAARKAWQEIANRWDDAGKVPMAKVKPFEARLRAVERAIREASDAQWKKSNPELSARADSTVGKLQKAIDDLNADLEKARSAGNEKKAAELVESIEARQLWLEQAQKALADFT